ncbi:preprotein translocase subunit Sec61beta [Candidatus Woesearchaeota archaeon]|nr:preprotein translocase subunit Sec61beta [Candidatus Woesearchaeota archaeon]
MTKDNISMPSGSGGIVRYFDEYKSSIVIKPGQVIFFILIVILFEVILHSYGASWFGL